MAYKSIFFVTLIITFLVIPEYSFSEPAKDAPIVRILISDDQESLHLSVKTKYQLYAQNPARLIQEGSFLNVDIKSVKDGISVGSREIKTSGISIKALKDSSIYIGSKRFRGDVDIIKKDSGKLMVINHINLEDYLYGVLYHEVSHRWPMEALKAQAIAARTFAVYQAEQNRLQPYDLRCDIYSQVYGGSASEKWSTTMAVNVTRGKVLTFNGKILPAYYHATCAGYTEDAANLWAVDLAPLKGVACDYCKGSPHFKWRAEMASYKLGDKLKESGYKIGRVVSISELSRNKSGRIDKLEIKDDSGVAVILTAKDFRQMIGPNVVRSTRFAVTFNGDSIILNGTGWGHGAGMCQWGAFGMAKKGLRAEEILKAYYPGVEITTI